MNTLNTLNKLEQYVEKGLLRKQEDEYLVQYNYSEYCNNNALWDDITLFNRGNIYEKATGKLIAKAMPKFFNFSQLSEQEQTHFTRCDKFINTEKMDGCLGIIYKYNGEIRCNSRGGFDNYVTDVIKKLLPKYNLEKLDKILEHNSLNVEVISPETKIICDYGDEENLYLISAFINLNTHWMERSIEELDLFAEQIGMPRPQYNNMNWTQLFKWQKKASWEKEGFVVMINSTRYGAFERVKIKSEDYLNIAKFKAGLSKHSLWKMYKIDLEQHTEKLGEYLEILPDELTNIAKGYMNEIYNELEEKRNEAYTLAESVKNIDRKDIASHFKNAKNTLWQNIYAIRDKRPFDKALIKLIEPDEKEVVHE